MRSTISAASRMPMLWYWHFVPGLNSSGVRHVPATKSASGAWRARSWLFSGSMSGSPDVLVEEVLHRDEVAIAAAEVRQEFLHRIGQRNFAGIHQFHDAARGHRLGDGGEQEHLFDARRRTAEVILLGLRRERQGRPTGGPARNRPISSPGPNGPDESHKRSGRETSGAASLDYALIA